MDIAAFFPVLLSLLAAAFFGINVYVQRIALEGADALTGSLASVGAMALLFWLWAPFVIEPAWWLTWATAIFLATGLLWPATGQTLQIVSIARVGPSLTAAIGSFVPAFAVGIAVVALNERLTLQAGVGLALMIAALIIAAGRPRGLPRGWSAWLLGLPLGAAFARGVSQPVLKIGMMDLPSPYFATLMAVSTSTVVLGGIWLGRREGRRANRRGLLWFALSGILNGVGIFALITAIDVGSLLVVSPLAATTPLWALFFGFLFFRGEALTVRHLVIALLTVIGGALILTS